MASQYIKIFNDTVLKQSILQGYESQRQNPNLGKFTSGELAFTRDTGRVFVGNYSDDPKVNDLQTVDGGILIGNKYLGIIDSRPIAYVQDKTTGTTGLAGLSYEEDNTSEAALFKNNTRIKKNGKINDWNNDPSFNSSYGTYNGDYLYDVWRNALIFFDNNIKPNSNNIKVANPHTKDEKVYDKLNNDITVSGRIRTPLEDLSNNENMKDYPIYGNGYVIFRLLEPDGKTIRFQPREITSTVNGKNIGNWTHNILEVDFSADNIISSFNDDMFVTKDKKITINNLYLKGNSKAELPSTITFKYSDEDSPDVVTKAISYDFVTNLNLPNVASSSTPYLLGYTYEKLPNGDNGIKLKQFDTTALNGLITKQDLSITLSTAGKLKVNGGYEANGTVFNLAIVEDTSDATGGVSDPWACGMEGKYCGVGKYVNGILECVNDYNTTFSDTTFIEENGTEVTESAETQKQNFINTLKQFIAQDINSDIDDTDHYNCNVGINYLTTPHTLSSLTTNQKTISTDSIADVTSSSGLRLIPDHAESIIVLITTPNETSTDGTTVASLSTPAEVKVTNSSTDGTNFSTLIFQSSQPNFTTTVEIPLIPKLSASRDSDGSVSILKLKTYSFTIKNCSAKLLGYRL